MKTPPIALVVVVLLWITKGTLAQSRDSSLAKKNELSIDLLPVLKIFSDIEQNYNYRGTVQYKRQLSKHVYFRFGFTLIKKVQARKYSDPYMYPVDTFYDGVTFDQYIYRPEVQFNPGIEYRWGKKRLIHFIGLDIGYAYSETIYKRYDGTKQRNYYFNPNTSSQETIDGTMKEKDYRELLSYSNMTVKNAISFTPFYGMQYLFSKRFFFSMQLGIQLQYLPAYKHTRVADPLGIINNFSIAYRF
jgi:hypothetical protein